MLLMFISLNTLTRASRSHPVSKRTAVGAQSLRFREAAECRQRFGVEL
jgi:hypothetical protein